METSIARPRIAPSHSRLIIISLAALILAAVLFGVVLTSGAQAYSYSSEELAFVNLINEYRVSNGFSALLISDMISEASYRHSHDMAKYAFFSHYSVQSDWFAPDATPWARMALSGYDYYTTKGENIAAGQQTAADVFAAWKASSGHNANMLCSEYTVIGISRYQLAGSPYTFYWTTDFGGYADATAHTVTGTPAPTTTRYQQTDPRILYAPAWSSYTTPSACGGSYKRASASTASCSVSFEGTYLAWIATKGTTLGKAYVSLDGGPATLVDLYRSAVAYQQKVWNTGILTSGRHTVKIWRDTDNAACKFISVDAFDVVGTLVTQRYEQTDPHLVWSGTWSDYSAASASGGSYKRANTTGSSCTVNFTGTSLTWVATAGTTLSKAYVSLDGGPAVSVDLKRTAVAYQQNVWSTGTLANGRHTVRIWWDDANESGKFISVDAVVVEGTLN